MTPDDLITDSGMEAFVRFLEPTIYALLVLAVVGMVGLLTRY